MTVATPKGARIGTRWRLAVVLVAVLAGVGVVAVSGLDQSLVFYRTPTEVVEEPELVGARVRLGGLVQPGSLRRDGATVRFVVTDGRTTVPVVFTGSTPAVFRDGENALVEGTLAADGRFRGEVIMVRHSETYQGPDGTPYTPPPLGGASR